MQKTLKFAKWFSGLTLAAALLIALGLGFAFWRFSSDLPDHQQLTHYEPPITSRLFAADGRLIGEYARERRLFVPIDQIPRPVIQTFLAAEDQNFYAHPGIDFMGVLRAIFQNVANIAQNRRPVGASTITQQVAKNFLLTNEVSLERKIKEVLLAFRIERAYSKDRILELYLNQIYLGAGAYGVAAASQIYFGKTLEELTVPEMAFLAALPKAPSSYNPQRNPERAKARRDWVLSRMEEDGLINAAATREAQAEPIRLRTPNPEPIRADWYNEEIRRELVALYGEETVYEGGFNIRTSMDPKLQNLADAVLKQGLMAYDRRHGWRGPVAQIDAGEGWPARLAQAQRAQPVGMLSNWRLAMVLRLDPDAAVIALDEKNRGRITLDDLRWARQNLAEQRLGPAIAKPADALKVGDIVMVEPKDDKPQTDYHLRQIPNVGGAILAMDPHSGKVRAMTGGWDFRLNQYNRATQAWRQPGSSFKPFVYLAALDNGFTPASIILDSPVEFDQGPGLPKWRPTNYGNDFLGPTSLRRGMEKSRNLMTVRLAHGVGMETVADYARKFGVVDSMQPLLSMSLGAGETTLMRMVTAYAMLANGGRRITPVLVERVQDRTGKTILRTDKPTCESCAIEWRGEDTPDPVVRDEREQVNNPASVYQMVSILQGVTQRGTAASLAELNRTLAGKTGTTNDSFDVWFVGFSPDLVVGVFIGFDNPRTLGGRETGGSVAVPIFKAFMREALKDMPNRPFTVPPGVHFMPADGLMEAFKEGEDPWTGRNLVEGGLPGEGLGKVPVEEGAVIEAEGAHDQSLTAPPPPSPASTRQRPGQTGIY